MWEKIKEFFRTFKENVSDAWRLIRFNIKPIAIFVIVFTIVGGFLGCIFNLELQNLYRQFCGIPFVGDYTAKSYYLNPLYFLIMFVCLLGITYLSMIEIGALTRALRLSKHGKKAKLSDMIHEGINDGCRFLWPRNWPIILLVSLAIPFLQLLSVSNIVVKAEVPEFIEDYIVGNALLNLLMAILILALCFFVFYFVYALRIFADTDQGFIECCRDSVTVMKGNYIRTLLTLLIVELIISAIILGLGSLVGIASYKVMTELNQYAAIDGSAVDMVKDIIMFSSYIHTMLMPAVNLAILSTMYYDICNEKGIVEPESIEGRGLRRDALVTSITIGVIFIMCAIGLMTSENWSKYLKPDLKSERPQIVAHRGDSVRCPENSMPAFEKAIEEEADWIELDVHQTKDGVIVVSHDDNLKRICGKKVSVHDLTYDELMELEVGSWFSKEFDGLHLSTLDEVLKKCKGKIKVQIEIKPTKYDKNIEQAVVDIIKANDMVDDVVVLSLDTKPLAKIEEISPEITTMYCTVIAKGDVNEAPADWLSVEAGNVSHPLVDDVHEAGKKIFAWTINNTNKVQHMVDCGVDGILTDDPVMMDIALESCDYSGRLFSEFVDTLYLWVIDLY